MFLTSISKYLFYIINEIGTYASLIKRLINRQDYGFLGITLHQAVFKARNAPPTLPTFSEKITIPQSTTATAVINPIATTPPPSVVTQVRQQIARITYVN